MTKRIVKARVDFSLNALPPAGTLCQWSDHCRTRAITYVRHPVLGHVPCCVRCAILAAGNSPGDRNDH